MQRTNVAKVASGPPPQVYCVPLIGPLTFRHFVLQLVEFHQKFPDSFILFHLLQFGWYYFFLVNVFLIYLFIVYFICNFIYIYYFMLYFLILYLYLISFLIINSACVSYFHLFDLQNNYCLIFSFLLNLNNIILNYISFTGTYVLNNKFIFRI